MRQKNIPHKARHPCNRGGRPAYRMFFVSAFRRARRSRLASVASAIERFRRDRQRFSNNATSGTSTTVSGTKLLVVGAARAIPARKLCKCYKAMGRRYFSFATDGSVFHFHQHHFPRKHRIGGNLTSVGRLTSSAFDSGSLTGRQCLGGTFGSIREEDL